jgi:hypothetical protein
VVGQDLEVSSLGHLAMRSTELTDEGTSACDSEYEFRSGSQPKCLYRVLGGGDSSRNVVPIQITPERSTWAYEGRVT